MTTYKASFSGLARVAAVSMLMAMVGTSVLAQNTFQERIQDQAQDSSQRRIKAPIYGSYLMTLVERNQYRAKFRQIETEQERETFRQQHRTQMQVRASAKGDRLFD